MSSRINRGIDWYRTHYCEPKSFTAKATRHMANFLATTTVEGWCDDVAHNSGSLGKLRGTLAEILASSLLNNMLADSPYTVSLSPRGYESLGVDNVVMAESADDELLGIGIKLGQRPRNRFYPRLFGVVNFRTPANLLGVDQMQKIQRQGFFPHPDDFMGEWLGNGRGSAMREMIMRQAGSSLKDNNWGAFPESREALMAIRDSSR